MLADWLRRVLSQGFSPFPPGGFDPRRRQRRQRATYRPVVERLETRRTPSGDFGFALGLSGPGGARASAVATDLAGNAYVAGSFVGTVDFDRGPDVFNLTGPGQDVFVAKYTAAGALAWARQFGGTSLDQGEGIAVDSAGDVYTTGSFSGTADFDPGPGIFPLTTP